MVPTRGTQVTIVAIACSDFVFSKKILSHYLLASLYIPTFVYIEMKNGLGTQQSVIVTLHNSSLETYMVDLETQPH